MYQPDYYNPLPHGYYPYPVEMKHSGVGIASFIMGLIVGLIELVGFCLARYLILQHKTIGISPGLIVAGKGIIGGMALALLGVILGFIGLARRSKHLFAILGLAINGGMLLLVGGLMVIGLLSN